MVVPSRLRVDLHDYYPDMEDLAALFTAVTDDIAVLRRELEACPGVEKTSAIVGVQRLSSTEVVLEASLAIYEDGDFHFETFGAKLELLEMGFMYSPTRGMSNGFWTLCGSYTFEPVGNNVSSSDV